MSKVIEIEKVIKVYPDGTQALKDIDLRIKKGKVLGLIGPNGAGKTTLVKLILGLLKPTSGTCCLWGKDCYTLSRSLKRKTGFLLEELGLYDNLTIKENMVFWSKLYETDESKIGDVLKEWSLWGKRDNQAKELSAGMRQKLAIARCLIHDPPLIILDEPTSNLDPEVRKKVVQLLRSYKDKEKTLLITSHDLFDIERICEKVVLLRRGRIAAQGSMEDLKKQLGVGREVRIEVSEPIPETLVEDIFKRYTVRSDGERKLKISDEGTEVRSLVRYLVKHGLDVERAEEEKVSLEDLYTQIIKEDEVNEVD